VGVKLGKPVTTVQKQIWIGNYK